ncbi:hypothetical protein EF847_15115 [Actinobacteria bacterium YIM 96077]|nr:hypothetical protein EF847_15115 [Actinobacteria bacterium YIM 96077]
MEAVSAIRGLTNQPEVSENGGLRISSAADENGAVELVAAVAAGPEPQDDVVTIDDVNVYLDPQATPALDDKVLDAEITEEGQVRFEVVSQSGDEGPYSQPE